MHTKQNTYLVAGGRSQDLDSGTKLITGTNNFKYLGVIIRTNGDSNQEIKKGVNSFKGIE